MKTIGIIPARFASSRFPGKPLVDINGKSMIRRVYERSISSVDELYVATDDQRIFDHVNEFGGQVLMTSDKHESGTERCAEVIEQLEEISNKDVIINIQGDEPIIDTEQINSLILLFQDEQVNLATLIKPIEDMEVFESPNSPKVVVNRRMEALYFSRSPIPYRRNQKESMPPLYQHIGIYAYRAETLRDISALEMSPLEITEKLEQLRWIENGYSIKCAITKSESHSIDTPEDLEKLLSEFHDFLT